MAQILPSFLGESIPVARIAAKYNLEGMKIVENPLAPLDAGGPHSSVAPLLTPSRLTPTAASSNQAPVGQPNHARWPRLPAGGDRTQVAGTILPVRPPLRLAASPISAPPVGSPPLGHVLALPGREVTLCHHMHHRRPLAGCWLLAGRIETLRLVRGIFATLFGVSQIFRVRPLPM